MNMCCMSLYCLSVQHLNWTRSSFWINISFGGEGITFLSQNTVFLLLNFERNVYLWNIRNQSWEELKSFLSPASAKSPGPPATHPWPPTQPHVEFSRDERACRQKLISALGSFFLSNAYFQWRHFGEPHEGTTAHLGSRWQHTLFHVRC